MGGLNTVSPAAAMPPTEALQLFNLVASEFGLRSRLGSREWVTSLGGEVRSVLPFTGSTANGANNRLFVTTSTGIWDASSSTGAPTQVLAFNSSAALAGYGISHVFVNSAGAHFLLYTDEENGLHVYSEGGGWNVPTMGGGPPWGITGADPARFVFVAQWKSRLLYVEKDTSKAWYPGAGLLTGTVNAFDFAGRFKAGGPLVGLWNWTYDGGAGLDDSLVAISGGGDVAVYQGSSVEDDIHLKGVWTLGGAPPAGREIATAWGGDLLLLSRTGVLPISQLVTGTDIGARYTTAKVANLFNTLMLTRADMLGWTLRIHPEDNCLVVTVPTVPSAPTEQLVMALANRAWSRYRDLPIFSSAVWNGKFYFGTADGRVLINDGYVDGVLIPPGDPDAFTPVQWALLTAFQSLGDGRHKRVELIRPTILAAAPLTAFRVEPRYRYNFNEIAPVSGGPAGGSGTWDGGTWDETLWAGDYFATQGVFGAAGIGVEVAIAMRGQAVGRTIVVGWDTLLSEGGWL